MEWHLLVKQTSDSTYQELMNHHVGLWHILNGSVRHNEAFGSTRAMDCESWP